MSDRRLPTTSSRRESRRRRTRTGWRNGEPCSSVRGPSSWVREMTPARGRPSHTIFESAAAGECVRASGEAGERNIERRRLDLAELDAQDLQLTAEGHLHAELARDAAAFLVELELGAD